MTFAHGRGKHRLYKTVFINIKNGQNAPNETQTEKPRLTVYALFYFCFFMNGMLPIEGAILAQFKLTLRVFAVFHRRIIFSFAFRALQRNDFNSTFLFTRHNDIL